MFAYLIPLLGNESEEDDLIVYRERSSEPYQQGKCSTPLGWEPSDKRVRREALGLG
jgi:hypothetical protein